MSMISVNNLTFAYDGSYDNIFENVSFAVDTDWKLGFVGRNGRGKTTFLKLLMGKYEYQGAISKCVDFEYFPYEVKDKSFLTTYVLDEICPMVENWKIIKELNILNVSQDVLYRQFETLSNGEQTKILLAGMFLKENSFLLIDEPTNHLDAEARELVAKYLCSKKGFILVSHDRYFLDTCVDHILSINKATIDVVKGNFSTWLDNKEKNDNYEKAENEKLKKDISRLEKASKTASDWSDKAEAKKIGFNPLKTEKSISRRTEQSRKAKKTMSRSVQMKTRTKKAIEEKSELLKNTEVITDLKISPLDYFTDTMICAEGLTINYGKKTVCKDISFTISKGERVALTGKNGCGKSTILKLICGETIEYYGRFIKNNQLKISYVPQDTSFLKGNLTDFAEDKKIDESLLKAILYKFDFNKNQYDKDISDFSEGQKKKVLIAGSLCEKAHLYIWDEPLNFIDVFSRIQIEKLISQYKPTLLFVEHDRQFALDMATRTIKL